MAKKKKGGMTVAEAGRKGGEKTRATHGPEHFEAIGKKGGAKVRSLIEAGRAALAQEKEK